MQIAKVEFMLSEINNDLGRYVEDLETGLIDDLAHLDTKVISVCEEASKLNSEEFEKIRDNFESTIVKLKIFKEKLDENLKRTHDKIVEINNQSGAIKSYSKRTANDNSSE